MVIVVDEGSSHPVSLDKIWKLIEAHSKDFATIHPNAKNMKMDPMGENAAMLSWDADWGGRMAHTRMKATMFPPVAQAIEVLEGPFAGSKFVTSYVPKGNATVLNCVGDFKSPSMKDDELRTAAKMFLDSGFDEDGAYLKKMKW